MSVCVHFDVQLCASVLFSLVSFCNWVRKSPAICNVQLLFLNDSVSLFLCLLLYMCPSVHVLQCVYKGTKVHACVLVTVHGTLLNLPLHLSVLHVSMSLCAMLGKIVLVGVQCKF